MLDLIFRGSFIASGAAAGGESHAADAGHHAVSYTGVMVYVGFVIAILIVCMVLAKKGLNNRFFKNKITASFEQLYYFIENLAVGIIGPHGRKYIPMLMVFWLMIFVSNLVSLFFDTAPTADLGFNLAMALMAIGYVQWEGIRANGVIGHFSHFAGPKLTGALIGINFLIFPIEIISEAMKNLSLTLRLYGNIHGGHQAVTAMNKLGEPWVPVGAFLLPVKLLTCVVQALIFCLLLCVYIGLVTHHEHEEGHAHDDDHGHEDHSATLEPEASPA
ncbi:MAG: F0F1 ATP synthase subunit A [Chthonomonas sp.]|nr:F0F1 ATP synthase subunit A [Chthonomonas sp.]